MIDYLRFTQTRRSWPEVATRRALEYSYFWVVRKSILTEPSRHTPTALKKAPEKWLGEVLWGSFSFEKPNLCLHH